MTEYQDFKKRGLLNTSHRWFETSCRVCKNCLYSSTGEEYACLDMPDEDEITDLCPNYRKPQLKKGKKANADK